jgi:YD repeat-containing protein
LLSVSRNPVKGFAMPGARCHPRCCGRGRESHPRLPADGGAYRSKSRRRQKLQDGAGLGGISWDTINDTTGSNGGDIYTGLDRFGQLIETIWKPGTGSTNLVQSSYGRNRFGGAVWRRDDAAHAMLKLTNDNYYWYDGLYQVQQHERGTLNAYLTGITSPVQTEGFTFDEMGNWTAYDSQTPGLNQDRSYNKANEITSITNPSSVVQPNYDPAGNMTTMPKAGNWTTSCGLKWDAWNRLAQIAQGSDTPIQYSYDALTCSAYGPYLCAQLRLPDEI